MKKTEMLKKNYEFKKVLTKGKYYSGENIEAFVLKNKENKNYLGLAISTKIGKAYIRNHIKRLIREVYKKNEEKITESASIVFLWKKKVSTEKAIYSNIEADMQKILKKAELYKKEEIK